jgi:CRISPR-associated protein Cas6
MSLPQPSPSLRSRLVTFKLKEWNTQEVPIHFLTSCQQALKALDIEGDIYIDSNRDGNLAQRALQVHHRNILGFGVCVEGLNEDDSLKLQCCGLGGRKHFGCGWFYPVKTSKSEELE